jgi:hypothetical protein
MQKVSSCRGRPRNSSAYRGAQIEVAKAIVEMGRIGANLPRMRAEQSRKFKFSDRRSRRSLPARVNDTGVAEILGFVSDARGVKKIAQGSRAILPATSVCAVQNLIEHGCLPRRALSPVAIDSGHARAMKPFAPVMSQLMRLRLGSPPPARLQRKIRRLVALHRAALSDFREFENADRSRFRNASAQLRSACLAMRAAELSSEPEPDGRHFANVARAAMAVQEVLDQLVVSHWHLRTPRYSGPDAVRQFVPLSGGSGVPALAHVVAWVQERMAHDTDDFQTALEIVREIVRRRWGDDPFSLAPVPTEVSLDNAQAVASVPDDECDIPSRVQRFCDRDEALIASDPRLGPLYRRVGAGAAAVPSNCTRPEDRFVRRVLWSVGPGKLGAMILFQIAENWYFGEDRGESVETDFMDRLRAVRVWAAKQAGAAGAEFVENVPHADARPVRSGETACSPSWSDVKVMLRDLARIEVRSWTEMNMDVPDALPLDQQWWRAEAEAAVEGGPSSR